jgi:hypothetical protein
MPDRQGHTPFARPEDRQGHTPFARPMEYPHHESVRFDLFLTFPLLARFRIIASIGTGFLSIVNPV